MYKSASRVTGRNTQSLSASQDSKRWAPIGPSTGEQIGRVLLLSFIFAFLAGAALGAREASSLRQTTPADTAAFAYRSVGSAMSQSGAWVLKQLSIGHDGNIIQDRALSYLATPYQYCAFVGAYTASLGIGYTGRILTTNNALYDLASHPLV